MSRFSKEQIIHSLKVQGGTKASDICRRKGVSNLTFYPWKAKSGAWSIQTLVNLRHLEIENANLAAEPIAEIIAAVDQNCLHLGLTKCARLL